MSGIDNDSASILTSLNGNADITELKGITAEQMRASTVGEKEEGKDIVVTFGGLTWTPTYISKTKADENGNQDLILTLWLADSSQLDGGTYDVAVNKTFDWQGISTWNAGIDSADKPTDNYPDNMYGTSYMNAVVLNNGGYYKPDYSKDEVTFVGPNSSHMFAAFTTGEIAPYLDTPSQVTWQEYGQRAYANENWSKNIPVSGTAEGDPTGTSYNFYKKSDAEGDNYNYAPKDKSNQWAESKLWLPSLTETGASDTEIGIWATSQAQRANITWSWLRSGQSLNDGSVRMLSDNGDHVSISRSCASGAVRPALHLNLTSAANNTKTPPPPPPPLKPLDQSVSDNKDDPDIYKVETETGVDFHIKTSEGFLKLSEATENALSFDSSWTFYLDDNITLNLDNTYVPIGGLANPFISAFNGQNYTLNFNLARDGKNAMSTFGIITSSNFINLNINFNLTRNRGGSIFESVKDSTFCDLNINYNLITNNGGIQSAFGSVMNSYFYNLNIDFNLISDGIGYGSVFGKIADFNLSNSKINYNVNLTREDGSFSGLCGDQSNNSTCNFSHIDITGKIKAGFATVIGYFSNDLSFQNFYDVNANLTLPEVSREFCFAELGNCDINSCSFICQQISAESVFGFGCYGQTTVSNSQFEINAPNCVLCILFISEEDLGDLTIVESSFNFLLSDSVMIATLGAGVKQEEEVLCQKITLLDVVINCNSFTNILLNLEDFSGITDYPPNSYYSGVYIHDPKSNTTTILDPNFTDSKWCQDGHLNGGLPQLRRFVSISDFLPEFKMSTWAKQKND